MAQLVQRLCIDDDMVLTLVAGDEESGDLAGMVTFSRMEVEIADHALHAAAFAMLG